MSVLGYDCSFVTPPSKDFQSECSICLHILREPHIVGCCGYRFCRSCIDPIQNGSKICPLCNCTFSTLPDKQLERTLKEKLVLCSHKYDGCQWKGKLADLDDHLSPGQKKVQIGCLYHPTTCLYCEAMFLRKDIRKHSEKCPMKKIPCTYCEVHKDTASMLKSVHYGVCPMFPSTCPYVCGAQPLRKDIEKHISESCPKAIIMCSFRYVGCNVEMPRQEMAQHCDASVSVHMGLMKESIASLQAENVVLQQEKSTLGIREAQAVNKILYLETELSVCRQDNDDLREQIRCNDLKIEDRASELASSDISHLEVGNLSPCANEQMIRSIFGQSGYVESVTFRGSGSNRVAEVEFEYEEDARDALYRSATWGLNLKSQTLSVKAVFDTD